MHTIESGMPGIPKHTAITVMDEPGPGGAYHDYAIALRCGEDPPTFQDTLRIHFQQGPIAEAGVNGVQIEDLLTICRHRLECFQAGPFPCVANQKAYEHIESALAFLYGRTLERQRRGVEGKSQP